LKNIEIIHSNCKTGLPDNSIDVVLLYDVLHELNKPNEVLKEIHRVLKSNGILSVSDHHMKENEIISKVTNRGLFKLLRK
jgi:ubiquinone/menaquinone biosynthesis C-methylase UbiE